MSGNSCIRWSGKKSYRASRQVSSDSSPDIMQTLDQNLPPHTLAPMLPPQDVPSQTRAATSSTTIDSESSVTLRRTRGLTRGVGLDKEIVSKGKKPIVEIDLDEGRPIDAHQSKNFTTAITIAAREMPLHLDHRIARRQPQAHLAMDRLNSKIDLIDVDHPHIADIAMRHVGRSNRNRRCRIHKKWKEIGEAAKPEDYSFEDWIKLRSLFERQEYHEMSEKNKNNRSQLKRPHNTGSRPYSVVRHQISKNELNGEKCGEIRLYFHSHFKPDASGELDPGSVAGVKGKWTSSLAESTYRDMIAMRDQYLKDGKKISEAEICNKLLNNGNRSDCLIGRGYGHVPQGKRAGRVTYNQLQDALHEAQERTKKMEKDMEEHLKVQKHELEEVSNRVRMQVEQEVNERIKIEMEQEISERVRMQVARQVNDMMKTFMCSQATTSFSTPFSDSPTGLTQNYVLRPMNQKGVPPPRPQKDKKRLVHSKHKRIYRDEESHEDDED